MMIKKTHKNRKPNKIKIKTNTKIHTHKTNSIKPIAAKILAKKLGKVISDTIKKRLSTFKITKASSKMSKMSRKHQHQKGGALEDEDVDKLYESIKGDLEQHINEGIIEIESSIEGKMLSGMEEIDSTVDTKISNAFEEIEGIVNDKISGGIEDIMDEVIPKLTNLIYQNQEQLVKKIGIAMNTNTGQIKSYVDKIFKQINEDIEENSEMQKELYDKYIQLYNETGKEFNFIHSKLNNHDISFRQADNVFKNLEKAVNDNIRIINNVQNKVKTCCP